MRFGYRLLGILGMSLMLLWGALRLLAAPDVTLPGASPLAPSGGVITQPVTAASVITPGVPLRLGDTDVTLTFAPGASGAVTATLVPTTPVNPPPGRVLPRSWFITTTTEVYTVTATFGYSRAYPADVVLALDTSGSMEFDTLCYGCWTPSATTEYPDGNRWPLRWDGPMYGPPAHCQGNNIPTISIGGISYDYIAIEAEEYSALSNAYQRDFRPGQGYTYWAMQRNGQIDAPLTDYLGDSGAYGRDTQGAYIMHEPFVGYTTAPGASGVACTWADLNDGRMCRRDAWIINRGGPYPAPRLDYGFRVPTTGPWYIWVRAQGGDVNNDALNGQGLFWGLNGGSFSGAPLGRADTNRASGDDGWHYNGAEAGNWTWRRLLGPGGGAYTPTLAPDTSYTLHLWAGSAGYAVDRILITTYGGDLPSALTQSAVVLDNNRTAWACDPCDARFGGYPLGTGGSGVPRCDAISGPGLSPYERYRYLDDLYDDEQPIVGTVAAAVRFIRQLDYALDQLGLVVYTSTAAVRSDLLCLEALGEACNLDAVENGIVDALWDRNQTYASGSSNIPDALEEAIALLGDGATLARPGVPKSIALLTDGVPDTYSHLRPENQICEQMDLWPDGAAAHDCTMYFAQQARDRGIRIFAITLGEGADQELMAAIAETTGGVHLHAESPDRLDEIFDEIEVEVSDAYNGRRYKEYALYHRESAQSPWQVHPMVSTYSDYGFVTGDNIHQLSEWTAVLLPLLWVEADPLILPSDGQATAVITATMLHQHYWPWPPDGSIVTFSTSLGAVSPITGVAVDNVVTTTFTAGFHGGEAMVTAQARDITGSVTLQVTTGLPHQVALRAFPLSLPANGQARAMITATVTNEYGYPVAPGTLVTFATSLGTVASPVAATVDGVVTATLTSGLDLGVAAITATAGSVSDTVEVAFVPLTPHSISVAAYSPSLLADGHSTTTLTATVRDEYAHPVADSTPVTFTTSLGTITPSVGTTVDGVVTATLTSGLELGLAVITAAGDVSGTVEVAFVPLAPHTVAVQTAFVVLPADGQSATIVTATVTDEYGHPVAAGTPVVFTTTLGALSPLSGTIQLPPHGQFASAGVVTTTLTASLDVGVAQVTAAANGVAGTVAVAFVPLAPYTVSVTVHPTALPADGASTALLTAAVTDRYAHTVADGTPVTWTATLGAVSPLTATTTGGLITATFTAGRAPGRASVSVTAGQAIGGVSLDVFVRVYLPLVLRQ